MCESAAKHMFVDATLSDIYLANQAFCRERLGLYFGLYLMLGLLQDKGQPSALEQAKLEHPVWQLRTAEEARKAWEAGIAESQNI